MSIGRELLNVDMGAMIRQMALAIADAQLALDASSMEVAEMMSGWRLLRNEDGFPYEATDSAKTSITPSLIASKTNANLAVEDTRVFFGYDLDLSGGISNPKRNPKLVSMFELGFSSTFYQFVDTIIEVRIAIKMTQESEVNAQFKNRSTSMSWGKRPSGGYGVSVSTSQVDGTYSAKYSYSAEGSSLLRTKLSPVPPPPILEERIRVLMEAEAELLRRQLAAAPN